MTGIKTRVTIFMSSYLDACAVKGHYLDRYACIQELTAEIRCCIDTYCVEIIAIDVFDRINDFTWSQQLLLSHDKCFASMSVGKERE